MATSTHHTFQIDVRGNDAQRGWIFYALRTELIRRRLISFATGTTVAALPADALLSQEIPLASDEVIDCWWAKASAIREAQESVAAETRHLVRACDEILPLLMSGRVQVEDVAA
jgi:type I restriction enzyme, S subunit